MAEVGLLDRRKSKRIERDKALVLEYLGAPEGEDDTDKLRVRRKRMLQHPDMPKAVKALLKFSDPERQGDDVRAVLAHSFILPELWDLRKDRPREFARAETRDLAMRTESFRAGMLKHPELVLYYLGETHKRKTLSAARVHRRFDLLLKAVSIVQERAASGNHWITSNVLPAPPKLPGHNKAREQFCVQALATRALQEFGQIDPLRPRWHIFELHSVLDKRSLKVRDAATKQHRENLAKGRGIHAAIATLVSSALKLTPPIPSDSVKQFLRHRGTPL